MSHLLGTPSLVRQASPWPMTEKEEKEQQEEEYKRMNFMEKERYNVPSKLNYVAPVSYAPICYKLDNDILTEEQHRWRLLMEKGRNIVPCKPNYVAPVTYAPVACAPTYYKKVDFTHNMYPSHRSYYQQ